MNIRKNNYITVNIQPGKKFKVVETKTGYKKDCFDTDIGERYFLNNRFKTWKKYEKK